MSRTGLRPVRWAFDGTIAWDGLTDDTYWNGFLNVRVTPEIHARVCAFLATDDGTFGESYINEVKIDADGLYDYGHGFATHEVDPADDDQLVVAP